MPRMRSTWSIVTAGLLLGLGTCGPGVAAARPSHGALATPTETRGHEVTLRCAVAVQKPVASGFLPPADAIERYQLTIRTAGPALAVEGYDVTAVSEEQIAFHKAGTAFLLDRYTLEVEVQATDPPAGAAPNAGPRRGTCRRIHRQL